MELEKKEEPKKRQTPRFIHFGWHGQTMKSGKKKHDGVLTVAYRQKQNQLYVGFVFCSPCDNFSRKEGREEALRFMRNYPIIISVREGVTNRKTIVELVNWLCDIGSAGKDWYIPESAMWNASRHVPGTITNRVPGWAKKWWAKLLVTGFTEPGKPFEYPSGGYAFNTTIPDKLFEMPVKKFMLQAQKAGINVSIVLG
jgi:hypothetical protein